MEYKAQHVAACNSCISGLSQEVETLSSSLQEKEAAVAQLESELQSYQAASTPKLLSAVIALTTEIAELKKRLQEAESQRQQSFLEREAAVQEVEAKKKVEMQLHRYLGKVVVKSTNYFQAHTHGFSIQMNLPRSLITPKA